MRGAPQKRILAANPPNQFTDFLRHWWAPGLAAADFPCPEQAESLAVPGNQGIRFYDAEGRAPRGPCSTKPGPEYPVESVQLRFLHGSLQHAKLMAKREDLKLQCSSSSENRQGRRKECR